MTIAVVTPEVSSSRPGGPAGFRRVLDPSQLI